MAELNSCIHKYTRLGEWLICEICGWAQAVPVQRPTYEILPVELNNLIKEQTELTEGIPGLMGQYLELVKEEKITPDNEEIRSVFVALHELLQHKNRKYGNSGLEPINVFSKVDSTTGLLQRIDDKIARIKNSPTLRKNDIADLTGYLVLLCVTEGWNNFDEFKD